MTESNEPHIVSIDFENEDVTQDLGVAILQTSHKVEDTEEICDKHFFIELKFVKESGVSTEWIDVVSPLGMAMINGAFTDSLAMEFTKIMETVVGFSPDSGHESL